MREEAGVAAARCEPIVDATLMLGAAYAGGIWFFVRSLRAPSWGEIQIGFPAVGTFASILGIATILHWDRFIHGNPAFFAWFGLYFTTPFVVFATWFRQRRRDTASREAEAALPRGAQVLFGGVGIAVPLLSAVRILAEAQIFSIVLILVAVWRDQSDIAFGSPTAWLFALGLAGLMTILVVLYVLMDRRSRARSEPAPQPAPI